MQPRHRRAGASARGHPDSPPKNGDRVAPGSATRSRTLHPRHPRQETNCLQRARIRRSHDCSEVQLTSIGAPARIDATIPKPCRGVQAGTRSSFLQSLSTETQLNTAVDRTGVQNAIANADAWTFDPAMAALKMFARMNPDFPFEAYDLEEQFGIHFEAPARWGALFQTAHKAGYIEPVGFTQSRCPAHACGVTRVWMAARGAAGQ